MFSDNAKDHLLRRAFVLHLADGMECAGHDGFARLIEFALQTGGNHHLRRFRLAYLKAQTLRRSREKGDGLMSGIFPNLELRFGGQKRDHQRAQQRPNQENPDHAPKESGLPLSGGDDADAEDAKRDSQNGGRDAEERPHRNIE